MKTIPEVQADKSLQSKKSRGSEKTIDTAGVGDVGELASQSPEDEEGPQYLPLWQLLPICIAMGLGIFILGLASKFRPRMKDICSHPNY
jgi:hypothetical protein